MVAESCAAQPCVEQLGADGGVQRGREREPGCRLATVLPTVVQVLIERGVVTLQREDVGVPVVFGLMAVSFLLAALATLPIRTDRADRVALAEERVEGLEA